MRPIEQIQAINEQANGPGVWSGDQAQAQALHNRHCGHAEQSDEEFWDEFFGLS